MQPSPFRLNNVGPRVPTVGLRVAAVGVVALLAPLAWAGIATPELNFTQFTLPNGLQVLLSEDHSVPLTSVEIWYHVGAKSEVPGRSGFAHLFEHIMFQGSRDVGEDLYFKYLEGAGATLINGTTDFDRTNYFETVPSNQLDLALWLESDRMGFLLDTLSQARLDNQRDVVRKERQQSTENVPYGKAEEQFYKQLFPAPHPYNGVVIGSHADLQAATLDDVKGFFKTYYVPNNATLAVVGDYNPLTIKDEITKYFGDIPRAADPPKEQITLVPHTTEQRLSLTDNVELARVYFGWVTPSSFQPGDAELTLAANVLSNGKASRLQKALTIDKAIASDVSASQYDLQHGSVFSVQVTGNPGETAQQVEDAAWPVIQGLATTPPTKEELNRALTAWQATTLRQLQSLGGFGGKADMLNYYNHHTGDPGYLPKDFARMEAVTPESLAKVYGEQIKKDNRVVVQVSPPAPAAPAAPTTTPAKAGGAK